MKPTIESVTKSFDRAREMVESKAKPIGTIFGRVTKDCVIRTGSLVELEDVNGGVYRVVKAENQEGDLQPIHPWTLFLKEGDFERGTFSPEDGHFITDREVKEDEAFQRERQRQEKIMQAKGEVDAEKIGEELADYLREMRSRIKATGLWQVIGEQDDLASRLQEDIEQALEVRFWRCKTYGLDPLQ